jgi:glucose-6-phosphate 1-dehydrogenase
MASRDARIVVNFRPAPHAIFSSPAGAANRLVINLQPKDGLELHLMAAGQDNRQQPRAVQSLAPVHLDLDFDKRFGSERVGAYERLLLDVIDGRLNLFVRSDEQEEAWRWVEPVMEHWRGEGSPLRPYAAGTWGPSASSAMIARDGYCWSEESLDRIKASLTSLAPAEQRVGKLVLSDPRSFANLPVSELADPRPREQTHRRALLPQHGL